MDHNLKKNAEIKSKQQMKLMKIMRINKKTKEKQYNENK